MRDQISRLVDEHRDAIVRTYDELHAMPEWGHQEFKTSAYIKAQLEEAGIPFRQVTETGLIAEIKGNEPGPTVGLRVDMDALPYKNEAGETYYCHACGHDAHTTMGLWAIRALKELGLVRQGTMRVIFQPAEERLTGAKAMVQAGAGESLDELYGVHLRPIHDTRLGQAAPALIHNASGVAEVTFSGRAAHGSRPHLGINAIDAAALSIVGINSIWANPVNSWSAKVTKISGGGVASNIIPDRTVMTVDMRAQNNEIMDEIIAKVKASCQHGAAAVGAEAELKLVGVVPTSPYTPETVANLADAIQAVLGQEGLLDPILTSGGDDFHEFKVADPELKTAFLCLGADLTPGLHDPTMTFNKEALLIGTKILALAVANRLK
ncbi:MAG: amidohydrolase [bacterium]